MNRWAEYRVFWREFRENFHTTGAVMPSGRRLARALARNVDPAGDGRRILEVGPGTGAVTTQIVRQLRPRDTLDLVELNDRFVERLRDRFLHEPEFQGVAARCRVLHQPVQALSNEPLYDLIISGLPLNNFSVELVEQIVDTMLGLLKPGGTLSFFEYIGVRHARTKIGKRAERERLRGLCDIFDRKLNPHEVRRDWVWLNVPPAWVHHVRP